MTTYLIVDISDFDSAKMAEYNKAVGPLVDRFGGEVLAADENPMILEGQWNNRVLLLSFPSKDSVKQLLSSAEYAPWKKHRRSASDSRSVAIDALPATSS